MHSAAQPVRVAVRAGAEQSGGEGVGRVSRHVRSEHEQHRRRLHDEWRQVLGLTLRIGPHRALHYRAFVHDQASAARHSDDRQLVPQLALVEAWIR